MTNLATIFSNNLDSVAAMSLSIILALTEYISVFSHGEFKNFDKIENYENIPTYTILYSISAIASIVDCAVNFWMLWVGIQSVESSFLALQNKTYEILWPYFFVSLLFLVGFVAVLYKLIFSGLNLYIYPPINKGW